MADDVPPCVLGAAHSPPLATSTRVELDALAAACGGLTIHPVGVAVLGIARRREAATIFDPPPRATFEASPKPSGAARMKLV